MLLRSLRATALAIRSYTTPHPVPRCARNHPPLAGRDKPHPAQRCALRTLPSGEGLCPCGEESRRAGLAVALEALVEIQAHGLHQGLDLAVEEMVRARNDFLIDDDALLGLELLDEAGHVLGRDDGILVAMDDEARGRAGREEREVIEVGRRADRNEDLDPRPPHQKLHADPG